MLRFLAKSKFGFSMDKVVNHIQNIFLCKHFELSCTDKMFLTPSTVCDWSFAKFKYLFCILPKLFSIYSSEEPDAKKVKGDEEEEYNLANIAEGSVTSVRIWGNLK